LYRIPKIRLYNFSTSRRWIILIKIRNDQYYWSFLNFSYD
jgi:hypothetical protein